jgi:hypothetical protein
MAAQDRTERYTGRPRSFSALNPVGRIALAVFRQNSRHGWLFLAVSWLLFDNSQ